MSINWKKLEISKTELEEILNLNLLSNWAIEISYVFLLRQKKYRKSLLFTEVSCLFMSYLLLFPIVLIIFRNFGWLTNNSTGLILIVLTTLGCLILIFLILNYYLWMQAKKYKRIAIILQKVNQYNQLVNNLTLITNLNLINCEINQKNKKGNAQLETNLNNVLNLTRNSLLKSLELEKTINYDRNTANNCYHLLANLEASLVNVVSFVEPQSDDYQQTLSKVIEIGLSVHQEIRKIKTLRQ